MNSIVRISLVLVASLIGSITAASCNVCNNNNHVVYNKNLVHTIQNDRLGNGGKRNWSCKELEDTANGGGFTSQQCADAQQIATRYCGCGVYSAPSVETNGVCSFCSGKSVPNRNKFPNTWMGTNAITCGEIIDGGNGQFWPSSTCQKFKNNNVDGQCCPGISAAPGFGLVACFSGENMVNVADRGRVRMDEVKLGDKVAVEGGKFSRVYSFGHRDTESATEYLQIHVDQLDAPLEITKEHMLFVQNTGAIPASLVSPGDKLVLTEGTASVTMVSSVTRTGAYAPFTESGTLVVSDVLASSFISVIENESTLSIGGVEVATLQWLAHAFEAPHRLVCKLSPSFCDSETYTSDGISHWVNMPLKASSWLVNQSGSVQVVLSIGVVIACTIMYLIEFMLTNAVALTCVVGLSLVVNKKSLKSTRS